ncbi:2-amino-4-hydroxy-6-hydroxymethyldihydropteridine diphosphokinase [Alicyclobacillus mengziensis]|uniref:2-amino-4-hydroxy-6-hydroxymethyldihydropteridine diphosphokinase n=1 Tax=Alicyclobacillus mengziensis TaxID=2931921 RepID=A0A9X7W0E9_9BACL|nr:2-amino-4-hydroxy-6-hydroxymethyldihydropteridine diphosphokinase [Alicyclobacillus mengziensis]QSO47955.1 2-amino-4-hydroxy-6-hydroxymethyldihydropteridine diphosphokinase [Alicyclobacillus mengziensis]
MINDKGVDAGTSGTGLPAASTYTDCHGRLAGRPITVYVALGSNVGRRIHHLADGVHALSLLAVDGLVRCSAVYETDPVGYLNQGPFLNMAACLSVTLSAHDLLSKLLEIETSAGRVRTIPSGPRTLDLDILLFGKETIHDSRLQVPHPRMQTRAFVLCPLADLAPQLVLEGGRSVQSVADELSQKGGIHYVGRFW